MDKNSIISSGLLESYVLGMCTVEEKLQVDELCAKYPELIKEIEAIEKALIDYAATNSPKISNSLKDNLMLKLNEKATPIKNVKPVNSIVSGTSKWYGYAAAAAIALLLISSTINFILYSKTKKQNTVLLVMQQEQNNYLEQLNNQKTALDNMKNEMALLADANTKLIRLKGTSPTSDSKALIYWNSTNKETYLSFIQLPTAPKGKQYQLWAIVNGKPVDAGVFDSTNTVSLQKMKQINNAQAFAVTLENEGGSPTPTLTTLCLLGNV